MRKNNIFFELKAKIIKLSNLKVLNQIIKK